MNTAPRIDSTTAWPSGTFQLSLVDHLRLVVCSVVAQIIAQGAPDQEDALFAQHPFLSTYAAEITAQLAGRTMADWPHLRSIWEADAPDTFPLIRLRDAGIDVLATDLLVACGLPDEDPRFGDLYESAQGQGRRPSLALLMSWWRSDLQRGDRAEEVRLAVFDMVRKGLLEVVNPADPRSEWQFLVPAPIWDALRGDRQAASSEAPDLDDLILPDDLRDAGRQFAQLVAEGSRHLIILRGAPHSGRTTLIGAMAQAAGLDTLICDATSARNEAWWLQLGALACLRGAIPVLRLDLPLGEEAVILPSLPLWQGPLAVVTGETGHVGTADGRVQIALHTGVPSPDLRVQHWQSALPEADPGMLAQLAQGFRLGSGTIRRVARTVQGQTALTGRSTFAAGEVREAARALYGTQIETLARRLPPLPRPQALALDAETRGDIDLLLLRCRHREAMAVAQGDPALLGVRALFSGPSGTGKTHAARLVAEELGKDIYRVDLAATVNKYIGETEKNLDRALSAAEDLDAVLLLDEGDALMTGRTDVTSANDRYANLETNFLLQRMESHRGILLVTTNAAARIDKAFARRIDLIIAFRLPDEMDRYAILRQALSPHCVPEDVLQEAAYRCVLSGAQLRSAALQAQLTALDARTPVGTEHLLAALAYEYRKTGAHCPIGSPASQRRN